MMSEFNPMWEIFKDNRSQFVVVLTINLSYTYYYSSITTGSGSISMGYCKVQFIHYSKEFGSKEHNTESFCNLQFFSICFRLLDFSVTKSECGRCRDWISLYGIFPKTSLNVNLHRGGSACNVTYCIELRVGKSHQMFWCLAVTAEI